MRLREGIYQVPNSTYDIQVIKVSYQNERYAKIKVNLMEDGLPVDRVKNYKVYKAFITHWVLKRAYN